MLAEHPHLKIVLDIHRDAGKSRQDSIVTINGQQVAPILKIIGSDARARCSLTGAKLRLGQGTFEPDGHQRVSAKGPCINPVLCQTDTDKLR